MSDQRSHAAPSVVDAIRRMLREQGQLATDGVVEHCVLVAETVRGRGDQEVRETVSMYPMGSLDPQTERGMLDRALDALSDEDDD